MSEMTDAARLHDLAERVERIERQNRRLRTALAAAGALLSLAVLMGAKRNARTVQAKQFVLVDDEGTTRAILGMRSAGPALSLYDDKGHNVEAMLGVLGTGPALGFYGEDETVRVLLGAKDKGVTLSFNDEKGKMRAELGWSPDTGHLMFFDASQKTVYKVPPEPARPQAEKPPQ